MLWTKNIQIDKLLHTDLTKEWFKQSDFIELSNIPKNIQIDIFLNIDLQTFNE